MKDINGKEFQLNDFIKVTGAGVKNDNGIFILDTKYKENDFCCHKVKTNGERTTSGYNIMFLSERELNRSKFKNVKIEVVEFAQLKQAAKEVKEYINGVTASEKVYSFIDADTQEAQKGLYLTFKKTVLLTGHTNSFGGTYEIVDIYEDKKVSLHLVGVKGEKVSYNTNNNYQGRPIILTFSDKLMKQLFDEEYITIQERIESTKGEAQKEESTMPIETTTAETVTEVQQEVIQAQEEQTETIQEATQEWQEEEKQPETIERKYFSINETLARNAKSMWSFSDYVSNSATNEYKHYVNEAYKIIDQIAEQKPQRLDEALTIVEKYSRKLADWMNKSNSIEMMCPSVMICGGSNFPVRKKEKQNSARDSHMKELEYINGYVSKLENILNGQEIIKSNDENAIEKLQEKVEQLEKLQETMKAANTYYKKNGSLQGFTDLKQETIDEVTELMKKSWFGDRPFPAYELTNNNAKIKNTKERLEALQKTKAKPTQETIKTEVCQVVENTEEMRIQLIFDGKPNEQTRNILKSNGFRWAPSQGAWQRQLTDNARYSTKKVIEQLEKLTA
jgi:hypothetical protein